MKLDRDAIKGIIMHREPFLLVDEVIELEPGVRGVGLLTLTGEEYFFAGHFPQYKVMPGVLIAEALAQTGGVILMSHPDFAGKMALFGGISKMKFRAQVHPGDTLRMEVLITHAGPMGGRANVCAQVNGKEACSGEIFTVFKDMPGGAQ